MLEDLDEIMADAGLDWIVAFGSPRESTDVAFLLEGARVGHATVLKRRGERPFAVVGSMERDEARRAGLAFAVPNDYGAAELLQQALTPVAFSTELLIRVLERHEVAGRVAFAGEGAVRSLLPMLQTVLERLPAITFAPELDQSSIGRARETKSAREVERIRSVATRTEEVVRVVLAMLAEGRADGDALCHADGRPLKIGEVKERIRLELARRGLDDKGETIFAGGREAGFPHSRGDETLPVPVGKAIIFDIFPCELGGGYYYDMTRTYWIGEVSEATRKAYAAVREAFSACLAAARPGQLAADLDALACDVLERHGYVTKRTDPKTEVGYLHSLGHGVGLAIHERPSLSTRAGNVDRMATGQVFTIEPGLYFPDEELGVRLEDTCILGLDKAESLATLPLDPEIRLG